MSKPSTLTLRVGTRTSKLALWQTDHIIQALEVAWPDLVCVKQPFVTKGDKTLDKPLPEIGGKGLFTAELERALHDGLIDIAVHSLKDLPVEDAPGLTLGAITSRADVRDGLVAREGWTLRTLPQGARVGTSSMRRQAQLLAIRPDLQIRPIRGNVDTRVRKVMAGEYEAAVLAAAGLERLGLAGVVTQWLDLDDVLPAPGQGALAVQCRAHDTVTLDLLARIDDADVRSAVTAERAFLNGLGGGCSAPVAAHATRKNSLINLDALVAWPDGRKVFRATGSGDDAWALGNRLAQEVIGEGAGDVLRSLAEGPKLTPLRGKRIVVTRTRAQAGSLSRLLEDHGAVPIEIPMIQVASVEDTTRIDQAIRSLERYDWLIFTSVNGVERFWERLEAVRRAGGEISEWPQVAAVGPSTASALVERGVQPDFTPDTFVGEAVAAGMGALSGQRVLIPRANIGRKSLPELLSVQGAEVEDLAVYRTEPAQVDPGSLAQLDQGVDAIMFTSGSTVRNWVAAVGGRFSDAVIACIGPITADVVRDAGLQPDVVASEYTIEGLVQALVEYFQERD